MSNYTKFCHHGVFCDKIISFLLKAKKFEFKWKTVPGPIGVGRSAIDWWYQLLFNASLEWAGSWLLPIVMHIQNKLCSQVCWMLSGTTLSRQKRTQHGGAIPSRASCTWWGPSTWTTISSRWEGPKSSSRTLSLWVGRVSLQCFVWSWSVVYADLVQSLYFHWFTLSSLESL